MFYLNSGHRYSRLTWFHRSGRQGESLGETAIYFDPLLSADGKSLAIEKADPNNFVGDLWIVDLDSKHVFPVMSYPELNAAAAPGPVCNSVAVWSPDTRSIVFSSDRDGTSELYTVPASGGMAQKLYSAPAHLIRH